MIEQFALKAKHYQVFGFLIIAAMMQIFLPNHNLAALLTKNILTVMAFIWIYMLGKGLNHCLNGPSRLSETFQTFSFFFIIGFTEYIFVNLWRGQGIPVNLYGFGVPLILYSTFSYGYLFYFAAKALTSAENGKRTSLGDYIGVMFWLMIGWGVWVIQPRVNKVYEDSKGEFAG